MELFLRNLLLNENHPLHNRTMHISGELAKQDIEDVKQDIDIVKQHIDRMTSAGLSKRSAVNAMKLYAEFGLTRFFGRGKAAEVLGITPSPASALLKKLVEAGVTEAVRGMGKGKYRFSPVFFGK